MTRPMIPHPRPHARTGAAIRASRDGSVTCRGSPLGRASGSGRKLSVGARSLEA
ncbi:hypothetical protein ACFPM0_24190 [Pseudonocardia sulfidoxydans]|uniref:hypothetical protein n=1 Tax=Pseudonocardia sulfidoxydans TaxID=54011 RepID=UPI0036236E29